jgi:transcriptional regulator with XRE-family HTH domain
MAPSGVRLPAQMVQPRGALSAKLGARLRTLRRDCHLTQTEVAEALHAEQQDVSRVEMGRPVNADLEFLDAMARLYHYTLADLLHEELPEPALTGIERKIVTKLRTMDSSDLGSFVRLILAHRRKGGARSE